MKHVTITYRTELIAILIAVSLVAACTTILKTSSNTLNNAPSVGTGTDGMLGSSISGQKL